MKTIRKLVFFVLLCVFIASCGKTPNEPNESLNEIQFPSGDYFPLDIGYWWKYGTSEDHIFFSVVITKKVNIGDQEYFERVHINGTDTSGAEYFRSDGKGNIFKYDNQFGDVLIYDFTTRVGDEWRPGGELEHYHVTVETIQDTVITPLGIFLDCLKLFFDIPEAIDDEYWEWYAKGVGLVKFTLGGGLAKNENSDNDPILIDTNVFDR